MTAQEVWNEFMHGGRVCPQPQPWHEVFKMLPGKSQQGVAWTPSLPLILGGWWESTDFDKRERFRLHLDWAEKHGALQVVHDYLNTLKPEDWHTEDN